MERCKRHKIAPCATCERLQAIGTGDGATVKDQAQWDRVTGTVATGTVTTIDATGTTEINADGRKRATGEPEVYSHPRYCSPMMLARATARLTGTGHRNGKRARYVRPKGTHHAPKIDKIRKGMEYSVDPDGIRGKAHKVGRRGATKGSPVMGLGRETIKIVKRKEWEPKGPPSAAVVAARATQKPSKGGKR